MQRWAVPASRSVRLPRMQAGHHRSHHLAFQEVSMGSWSKGEGDSVTEGEQEMVRGLYAPILVFPHMPQELPEPKSAVCWLLTQDQYGKLWMSGPMVQLWEE